MRLLLPTANQSSKRCRVKLDPSMISLSTEPGTCINLQYIRSRWDAGPAAAPGEKGSVGGETSSSMPERPTRHVLATRQFATLTKYYVVLYLLGH